MGRMVDLAGFVREADELAKRRFLQSGYVPTLDLALGLQGFKNRGPRPDEEDFRSFLISFRLFWMTREPFYLGYVYPVALELVGEDHEPRKILEHSRRSWRRREKQGVVRTKERDRAGNDVYPSNRVLIDRFITGRYFHRENAKKTAWVQALGSREVDIWDWNLWAYVWYYAQEVLLVRDIVKPRLSAVQSR